MIGSRDRYPFLLSTVPPGRSQRRLAGWVLAVLVTALLMTAPFSHIRLAETESLLPAYAAAILLVELLTSALLLNLFAIQNTWAILVLSAGYLFSGLLVIPWALTFPGVFTVLGLDSTMQSTATIAAVRRLSFPLFVLAYALLRDRRAQRVQGSARAAIAWQVLLTTVLAFGFALFVLRASELPSFMKDARHVTPLWRYIPAIALGLYVACLAVLWLRRRSTLDLWLMVVVCTLVIEILLLSYLSGGARMSVGWWGGRLYGLASASMVLLVLLSETMTLQARLARSIRSERLSRENRLAAMEALSASIAHEINQPLASMVTNASAGLRWLDKDVPRISEAHAALERVVRDGYRAREVVNSIRSLFRKGPQEHVLLDLDRLIREVLSHSTEEARFGRVLIETELDGKLPPATGNPLQIQQVVLNLVANAVDAMADLTDRPRIIRIATEFREKREILVSVRDNGSGIAPDLREKIFEPFFSTKPEGMGMGLMFSRSIIENHGGRLWAAENVPQGAVFNFTIPCYDGRGTPGGEAGR